MTLTASFACRVGRVGHLSGKPLNGDGSQPFLCVVGFFWRMTLKKFVPMLLTGWVMASIAGCVAETDPVSVEVLQTPAVAPAASKTAEGVLVSLSVPNMT